MFSSSVIFLAAMGMAEIPMLLLMPRICAQFENSVSGCKMRMPLQADKESAAARAHIQHLEADLAAAEGARDEFVYHLSPKKPPRPAGSPAPKADADQLRVALKVCLQVSSRAGVFAF